MVNEVRGNKGKATKKQFLKITITHLCFLELPCILKS